MIYIFRKSDSLFVGLVNPPHSADVELSNIVDSELGGAVDDYIVIEGDMAPSGEMPVMAGNRVNFILDPEVVAKGSLRNSGRAKLIALGLSAEELVALRLG